ncbi:hypothetical protein KMZ32_13715 [Phycicoccus sp. MAQZ13P-2]|uniref:hypothetical protein n=1 Tax=Phycicoccus mangrovi TaxID=2840470 RepID=UPI001BFFEB5E|nr:hypothetical protein [Phycicoccus mangrovi]MBT9256482.1 hypothetical protein [Phycicoccus mangrovi]MBT9275131.1 hypothetical protein [Phycicoccus mangrovi]
MTRVAVRSEALLAWAGGLASTAEVLRDEGSAIGGGAARLAARVGRGGLPGVGVLAAWVGVEADAARVAGPAGLWGEALALDALAVRLRLAAVAYAGAEDLATAALAGVGSGVARAASVGWFDETGSRVVVEEVPPRWTPRTLAGPGDLVALGEDLDGGRVRVVEVAAPGGGSAWVVVVPGTQSWSPRAGPQPFDLTTDLTAVTGDATLAGTGVTAALDVARAGSARRRSLPPGRLADEPVVLVGHSQGGLHAASLAADAGFRRGHRVTHVLTTGAPVGLVPVPDDVRVLSVEHADDPVPTLDLAPNPARASWLTLRVGAGPPVDVARHRLGAYERTVRAAAGAPFGTVPGVRAWQASAGSVLGRPVLGVTEVVVTRDARQADGARPP